MKITLDMKLPGITVRTLDEAVQRMKANGMVRLLTDDDDASEHYLTFCRSIERAELPTMGETLAAWYVAKIDQLETEMYADDSTMTNRQYSARLRAISAVVFRPGTR